MQLLVAIIWISHYVPVSCPSQALHCSLGPSVVHPWGLPPCASGTLSHVPLGAHVWLELLDSCHGLTYTPELYVDCGE